MCFVSWARHHLTDESLPTSHPLRRSKEELPRPTASGSISFATSRFIYRWPTWGGMTGASVTNDPHRGEHGAANWIVDHRLGGGGGRGGIEMEGAKEVGARLVEPYHFSTFFYFSTCAALFRCVFFALINVVQFVFPNFFRFDPQFDWNFKITMGTKKIFFPSNWGSVRCAFMRGFQVWYQNWNRIIFDLFLDKKRSKTGKIGYFALLYDFTNFIIICKVRYRDIVEYFIMYILVSLLGVCCETPFYEFPNILHFSTEIGVQWHSRNL